jgi:hypothetical protein
MLLAFSELHIRLTSTTTERRSGPQRRTQHREWSSVTLSRDSDARFTLALRALNPETTPYIAFDHHACAEVDHRKVCCASTYAIRIRFQHTATHPILN